MSLYYENIISPDDLAILNCNKTQYGTKVERLMVDKFGRIEGGIPSFAKVDEHLLRDWMNSLPQA
jgi:hypothetical protein